MRNDVGVVALVVVLVLLVTALIPQPAHTSTSAADTWYPGPDSCWYRGQPWWLPGSPFGPPKCAATGCPNHVLFSDPSLGYYEFWCPEQPAAVQAPAPLPAPTAAPVPVPLPAPDTGGAGRYQPGEASLTADSIRSSAGSLCPMPEVAPYREDMPWGTFGTYDAWARAFLRYHERCPVQYDVWDYWYSQEFARKHDGKSPW